MSVSVTLRGGGVMLAAVAVASCSNTAPPIPTLVVQESGTIERLQAISVVNDSVVWVSGVGGTVARTTNGGRTWVSAVVPGADSMQWRPYVSLEWFVTVRQQMTGQTVSRLLILHDFTTAFRVTLQSAQRFGHRKLIQTPLDILLFGNRDGGETDQQEQ